MFRRSFIIAMSLLGGCALLLIILLVRVSEQDVATYNEVVESALSPNSELQPGEQERSLVRKDILFTEGADRLHFRIDSEASTLSFSSQNGKAEMVEHMNSVQGLMQEELFWVMPDGKEAVRNKDGSYHTRSGKEPLTFDQSWKPMQQLRYIEADNASYFYNRDRFEASQTRLQRFRTAGHQLMDSPEGLNPTITGTADSVQFVLSRKGLDFHANHLKAKIYTDRGTL